MTCPPFLSKAFPVCSIGWEMSPEKKITEFHKP